MHDVYAYGVIAPSTLIELADGYPPAGGYAHVADVHESLGGEAAGSACVLGRLGIATKLAGNHLADDAATARVIDLLSSAGVDCSALVVDSAVRPITEIVVAAEDRRTVLATYADLLADRSWAEPSREDIRAARVVCVDPFFGDQSNLACEWSRETSTPYVTVDTEPDTEIAKHAEILIVSEEFASRTLDMADPRDLLAAYTDECEGLVILTRGGEDLWYARGADQPRSVTPFEVAVRDTTGAGDSFRAGIVYGVLAGYTDHDSIRFASAVSALICQRVPGVLNSPTLDEVERFLTSTDQL